MVKRVLLFASAVVFVVALNGCSTTGGNKDLEIQGLRNKVLALEAQESARIENSSGQVLATSSEAPIGSLENSAEASEHHSLKQIQTALKNAGYYQGLVDGKMGKKTHQAIKDFQKANNLSVDGKVGKQTWLVLKGYLEKKVK